MLSRVPSTNRPVVTRWRRPGRTGDGLCAGDQSHAEPRRRADDSRLLPDARFHGRGQAKMNSIYTHTRIYLQGHVTTKEVAGLGSASALGSATCSNVGSAGTATSAPPSSSNALVAIVT